ncbi:hypothetical protein Pmani_008244 [Petrolisthes manimaculis]|uniref:Uncharacterized protein n=1 Tax=Petrolisthes manimaculis TaxID=1843537 RepID=A0AAE1UEU0_9EUCA|nr:hypothetical protein Pmani_008244 [Petrolisthes manimaculis]
MAQEQGSGLENLVKTKVEEELANITSIIEAKETRSVSKTVKDVAAVILPGLANIIAVAVSTAVSSVIKEFNDRLESKTAEMQRISLLNTFENDKLEQYSRRENLRISGLEEEDDETEEVLEAKIIEFAQDIGVKIKSNDISLAHRMGRNREEGRPVIVRLCHRKKKNEIVINKKKLKEKNRKVYVNEDLTSLRARMISIVKEHEAVKNVTTRDGSILAWLNSGGRPVVVNNPFDLHKVGIDSPDWRKLNLDHLIKC